MRFAMDPMGRFVGTTTIGIAESDSILETGEPAVVFLDDKTAGRISEGELDKDSSVPRWTQKIPLTYSSYACCSISSSKHSICWSSTLCVVEWST